jgi:hypothetical protein
VSQATTSKKKQEMAIGAIEIQNGGIMKYIQKCVCSGMAWHA